MNVARQAALKAGLPNEVPGETVNRVCGSGLQAVVHAVEAIRVGYVDTMVAGGTESMSNAPYLLKGARWGYRMGNAEAIDSMVSDGLTCAIDALPHGNHGRGSGEPLQVSRAPTRTRSRPRASAVPPPRSRAVRFRDEIVPVPIPQRKGDPVVVTADEYPRAGTTVEKLAALKPAFKKDGTVTAGNASGINDGAAALVVVTTADKARKVGTRRWRGSSRTSRPASIRRSWASVRCRRSARCSTAPACQVADIDLFELNEAFAAQSVAVVRELQTRSGEGERERRRHRARPSDRRERRPRADDARLRAAGTAAALRCRVALHRRRHGHRDGGRSVVITIVQPVLDEVLAHAREDAPRECCGVLIGSGDRVVAERSRAQPCRRHHPVPDRSARSHQRDPRRASAAAGRDRVLSLAPAFARVPV